MERKCATLRASFGSRCRRQIETELLQDAGIAGPARSVQDLQANNPSFGIVIRHDSVRSPEVLGKPAKIWRL